MKKILIIADGILAKHFLERVFSLKNIVHDYTVIMPKKDIHLQSNAGDNVEFYHFDPTSLEKLKVVANAEFERCMIALMSKDDTIWTYRNLKKINPSLEYYVLDIWGIGDEIVDSAHTKIVDVREIVSSRLVDYLPDTPVYADNIGLCEGEIMEVKVPVGSSFAYRQVGNIHQKKWKICMIYRHNKFEIAQPSSIIMPNDNLLLVGNAQSLKDVFRSIKQEYGQFPSPFGKNIFLFVDMKSMSGDELDLLSSDAMALLKKISCKKLFIHIINPTINEHFSRFKEIKNDLVSVFVDYKTTNIKALKEEILNAKSGLFVTTTHCFEINKKFLYELGIPVLKVANQGINSIKKGVVLISGKSVEHESSIIFDVCSQLGVDIFLYHFSEGVAGKYDTLIEQFESLSKIFKKNLKIIDDPNENPIIKLSNESEFLQFIPFDEKVLKTKVASTFSRDLDELYYKLSDNYQLFIPTNLKA